MSVKKILICGDTHLNRMWPNKVMELRIESHNYCFEQIINYAIKNNVDMILHTGDFFDIIRPWPSVVNFVKEKIHLLEEKEIPLCVIRGNHDGSSDKDAIQKGSPIEYAKLPNSKFFHYIDPIVDKKNGVETIGYREFGDIQVFGCGYFGQKTLDIFNMFVTKEKITAKFPILLIHSYVESVNTEKFDVNDFIFPIHEISQLKFKICGVGHFHGKVGPIIDMETTFLNPGAIEKWSFHHPSSNGFWIVTIEDDFSFKSSWQTVDPLYPMVNIEVKPSKNLTKNEKWYMTQTLNRVNRKITQLKTDILLNVQLKGELEKDSALLNLVGLRKSLLENPEIKYLNLDDQINLDLSLFDTTIIERGMEDSEILKILKLNLDDRTAEMLFTTYREIRESFNDESALTTAGNLKTNIKDQIKENLKNRLLEEPKDEITKSVIPFQEKVEEIQIEKTKEDNNKKPSKRKSAKIVPIEDFY